MRWWARAVGLVTAATVRAPFCTQLRDGGRVQDLLRPQHADLALRENAAGVFVEGACEEPVACASDCLELLQLGERNRCGCACCRPSRCRGRVRLDVDFRRARAACSRLPSMPVLRYANSTTCTGLHHGRSRQGSCCTMWLTMWLARVVAGTAMNATSSRSHMIVQLTVVSKSHGRRLTGEQGSGGSRPGMAKVGKLFMVDLAGSERLKRSLSSGAPCPGHIWCGSLRRASCGASAAAVKGAT